jgi:hypothetical protein
MGAPACGHATSNHPPCPHTFPLTTTLHTPPPSTPVPSHMHTGKGQEAPPWRIDGDGCCHRPLLHGALLSTPSSQRPHSALSQHAVTPSAQQIRIPCRVQRAVLFWLQAGKPPRRSPHWSRLLGVFATYHLPLSKPTPATPTHPTHPVSQWATSPTHTYPPAAQRPAPRTYPPSPPHTHPALTSSVNDERPHEICI